MTSKIPAWAKGYMTVKNGVILAVVIGVVILASMLFGGWSIRETKLQIKELQREQKELKRQSDEQKQQIKRDSITLDSLYKDFELKDRNRQTKTTIIYQKAKENVEKINSPDFNNNDIREGFRSN